MAELFQLLISNHDYSVLDGPDDEYCCHNSEMFTRKESADKRIPIPFDFDMSGLVNANYASPPAHLPIRLVRTRFYRGLCQPEDVMQGTVAHMLSKKDEIMALFETQEDLSRLTRSRSIGYVRKFFEILEDDVSFNEEVLDRCRGRDRLAAMQAAEAEKD